MSKSPGLWTLSFVLPLLSVSCYDLQITTPPAPAAATAVSNSRASPASSPAATIVTGSWHTCGIPASGNVHCWGDNGDGRVGVGTSSPLHPNYPTPQSALTHALINDELAASVAAGSWHACALSGSGLASCWGSNAAGQLGNGTTLRSLIPWPVQTLLRFTSITAGGEHTCGLTSSGLAYCWGSNSNGQLGDGSTTPRTIPTAVTGAPPFTAISAGDAHTCGLSQTGIAYCWGRNNQGQLGNGTQTEAHLPTLVTTDLSFSAITAGGQQHTCALTEAGMPYCWGNNVNGQVGDGSLFSRRLVPTAVAGGLTLTGITAGVGHSCGVTSGGSAYCWGLNVYGQLGFGATSLSERTPREVTPVAAFAGISAGWQRTCARSTGGGAYCWGNNQWGAIGDGTTETRPTPTPVAGWEGLAGGG